MIEQFFPQVLLLLTTTMLVVLLFQRLRIPSSLAYLLVGVLLGAYTPGPVIEAYPVQSVAEFGIVFLLFMIGLSFSLPQIYAMRHLLLGLGTGQVFLSTLVLAVLAWLLGVPPAAAFVVGAVFAQSSTTIMTSQLTAQHEENSRHGRLGVAMSVFQDVTAVPFLVIIPVLATIGSVSAGVLTLSVGQAFIEAAIVFAVVFWVGRWVLRPLFHVVAQTRSSELFTLTVLVVSLVTAWISYSFGLSMAFGAFLAGMVLGETEFRHQVESTIRPFRDVLLGWFFIGVGMRVDPSLISTIWPWAMLGMVALMLVKAVIVSLLVQIYRLDSVTAWRTGWLMAVGGEFGFALLALGMEHQLVDQRLGQIILTSVLFAMIMGSFTIRYNLPLARGCVRLFSFGKARANSEVALVTPQAPTQGHVVICGYGQIGQGVAHLLADEGIPYVALDLDATRINEAHLAGEPVFYGEASDRAVLEAIGVDQARLVVITHDDLSAIHKTLHNVKQLDPNVPVMVRISDERHVDELIAAGASEVIPESLETSLMVGAHALMLLGMPISRVMRQLHKQWTGRYQLLREMFRGETVWGDSRADESAARLKPLALVEKSPALGRNPLELGLEEVNVAAVVRQGQRLSLQETLLEVGDVLVLFGTPAALQRAAQVLAGKVVRS